MSNDEGETNKDILSASSSSDGHSDDGELSSQANHHFPVRMVLKGVVVLAVIIAVVALAPYLDLDKVRRRGAMRIRCAANLKGIGNSLGFYAEDHENRFPPDLETLVAYDKLSVRTIHSPMADYPDYHCDYAYVVGLMATDPKDWVIAYGDPNWAEDNPGASILFVDGHAKFFEPEGFKQVLQEFFDAYAEVHGEYPKIIPPHDTTKEFWESRGVPVPNWDAERE